MGNKHKLPLGLSKSYHRNIDAFFDFVPDALDLCDHGFTRLTVIADKFNPTVQLNRHIYVCRHFRIAVWAQH